MMETELPTADEVVEELADRVAARIEHGAPVSFDAALDELVRYHRFLLGLSAQMEPDGEAFSYAEIEGSSWSPPHQLWIRQYRRLFDRAADKLPLDTHFVDALSHVSYRLIQPQHNLRLSNAVIKGILSLLPVQMHSFEAWVTRRSAHHFEDQTGYSANNLAGSDSRSYASALRATVGAWETTIQMAPYYLGWNDSPDLDATEVWDKIRESWTLYWSHLTNTAYCVAVAVWNDDIVGAKLFAEALIRWPGSILDDFPETYGFRLPHLIFPDLFKMTWQEASEQARVFAYSSFDASPRVLFSAIIRGARNDILLTTSSLLLHWSISKRRSELGEATARTLIRENAEPDLDLPNRKEWSRSLALLCLMRLQIAGERFEDGSYGANLDHFVRQLDALSEKDIVPGRVFTPSTLNDREGLLVADIALLASATASGKEMDVHPELREWLENVAVLPRGERSLEAISSELDRYNGTLDSSGSEIRSAVELVTDNLDATQQVSSLQEAISHLRDFIQHTRDERLRNLPIDPAKLESRRQHFENVLLTPPADAPFFDEVAVERLPFSHRIKSRTLRFVDMSKERFVSPPMGPNIVNEAEVHADALRRHSGRLVFEDLCRKKRLQRKLSAPIETKVFWDEIAPLVNLISDKPILLVSAEARMRLFDRIFKADPIEGVTVERNAPAGGRNQYLTTVAGVDVFGGVTNSGTAWLLSGRHLKAVQFAPATRGGHYVEVEFVPDVDGLTGNLEINFRQRPRWGSEPIFQIRCPDPPSNE